jgi:uncharacterized RDD family membrane protein YckC
MSQQPGWYDDPQDPDLLRYWDGVQWTQHTSPLVRPNLDQAAQSGGYPQGTTGPGQSGQGDRSGGYGQGGQQYGQGQYGQGQYGRQDSQQWGAQQGGWNQPMPGYAGTHEGATTPDGQRLAGWGRRLVARIIDWVIVGIASLALFPVVAPDVIPDLSSWVEEALSLAEAGSTAIPDLPDRLYSQLTAFTLASALLALAYEALLLKTMSGTLGKLALGMRVRLRDQPGALSWNTSALRALVWQGPQLLGSIPVLGFLASVFPVVNGLWPLWDAKKQSLNDKAAKTNVVLK